MAEAIGRRITSPASSWATATPAVQASWLAVTTGDPATTLRIYTHTLYEHREEVTLSLADRFGQAAGGGELRLVEPDREGNDGGEDGNGRDVA